MGVEAKPQLTAQYGGEVATPELRSYIDGVGRHLLQHIEPEYSHIQWEFTLLDSDVINAFALPGGKVFFSRGLLERFENEAQVAAVLGHEIGHVTAKHIDERVSQAVVAQVGLEVISAVSEAELITAGAQLLAQGSLLKFGRDQELEADRQGLKYMTRSGYNPEGMAEVLQILIEASKGSTPPEFLSTHPNPERRLAMVRDLMATQYSHTVNDDEYKKYPARFQQEARPFLKPQHSSGTALRRGVLPAGWCLLCSILPPAVPEQAAAAGAVSLPGR
jgi:predicted Zn-dependent protease